MVNQLTILTALIAFFGIAFGFVAQSTTSRPGSAFASAGGGGCKYVAGVVCTLENESGDNAGEAELSKF